MPALARHSGSAHEYKEEMARRGHILAWRLVIFALESDTSWGIRC